MAEENDKISEDEAVAPDSEAASTREAAAQASEADATPEPEVAAAAPAQPAEVVAPKERKRRAKAAKAAPPRAALSPEERHAERVAERRRKAAVRRAGRVRTRAKARARTGDVVAIAAREHEPGKQKARQGVVVSDKADKTITVRINLARKHRRYEKIVRTSTTLHAHDERNDANVGDTVVVRECRPLSRSKRWRLVEILERAK
jgi:small subunit ribosomal protein S17